MPRYSAFLLALALAHTAHVVHAIPVDEISVRNDVASGSGDGDLASTAPNSCTGTLMKCALSEFPSESLLKVGSGNTGKERNVLSEAPSGEALFSHVRGAKHTHKHKISQGNGSFGGKAPGGSAVHQPGLVEVYSDNNANDGDASRGSNSEMGWLGDDKGQKGTKMPTS